jgi:periplasmic protein TonB
MEPHALLFADSLDIIFENRNKSYGAYPLRKYYPQRLMISLSLIFSLVVLSSVSYWLVQFKSGTIQGRILPPDIRLEEINLEKTEKPILPVVKPPSQKPPAAVKWVTPVIVADQNVPEPMAAIDKIQTNAIGLKTLAGVPDNGEPYNNGNQAAGSEIQKADPVETKEEILGWSEVMPEFPRKAGSWRWAVGSISCNGHPSTVICHPLTVIRQLTAINKKAFGFRL